MIPVEIRNVRIGEGIPKICVPIVGHTLEEIINEANVIATLQADMVEWRSDWYEDVHMHVKVGQTLAQVRSILKDMPILFTFRTKEEGGEREMEELAYATLNKFVIDTGYADLIDVEIFSKRLVAEEMIHYAHQKGMAVIASNHDFEKTPDKKEIISRLFAMENMGADILKIAVMPKCEADVEVLLDATKEMRTLTEKPLITMSMSEMGKVSRMCGEECGSAVTFGSAGKVSAPGQVSVTELKNILEEFHWSLIKKG